MSSTTVLLAATASLTDTTPVRPSCRRSRGVGDANRAAAVAVPRHPPSPALLLGQGLTLPLLLALAHTVAAALQLSRGKNLAHTVAVLQPLPPARHWH
jgi:hypothetical protein